MQEQAAITQTQNWLKDIVIQLNFCPFAKREFISNSIRYRLVNDGSLEQQLVALAEECERLDKEPLISTSLIVCYNTKAHENYDVNAFQDYLWLVDLANAFLVDNGYEGVYQIASFHPEYVFADSHENEPSNYTNRSPYPILHILREEQLEQALENYPDPEEIPTKNIHLCNERGLDKLRLLLANLQL